MQIHLELGELLRDCARELGANPAGLDAIERPRNAQHGDYASGLALKIAKQLRAAPRDIASKLATAAQTHAAIANAVVAGPGFVNLTLTATARARLVNEILAAGANYGRAAPNGIQVLLEYVSANPTGPLHVGHGRAAATGDSIARIMRFAGYNVDTEYYLNDRGLQTEVLAASLWLRVCALNNTQTVAMPACAYAGAYLADVAAAFVAAHPDTGDTLPDLTDLPDSADAAARELVARTRAALGARFELVRDFAVTAMTTHIRDELAAFGVVFDNWFSERELVASGAVDQALQLCTERDAIYRKDGASWFKSTAYGDEQDWVVVRSNGDRTYFASDIAYHLDKCRRGYDMIYSLFGADHHGYLGRIYGVMRALGENPSRLKFALIQFVAIIKAGKRIKMSTRSGTYLALQELVDELGTAATRLSFVLSKCDSTMDFDIDRAGRRSADNPVYYMQYAHARICSLLERWGGDSTDLRADATALDDPSAQRLLTELCWFVPTLEVAAREQAPHRIAHLLLALAGALHGFYDKVPILNGPAQSRPSMLALAAATRQVLANGLGLLGVDAPTKM